MSAIEASSVRVQTMADSTLRLTVDIEPRFANEAFQLFGKVGTPIALAALKSATAQHETPKGGAFSQWAAMRCNEGPFCDWLAQRYPSEWAAAPQGKTPDTAAHVVRALCQVESRADIDNDLNAADNFRRLIMGPWHHHCMGEERRP